MGKREPSLDKEKTGTKRRKRNPRVASKLRSSLEDKVKKQLEEKGVKYEYETVKLQYTVPSVERSYTPDFILFKRTGEPIYVEAKGLWDFDDRYKHLLLRQQRPDLDIRFVFQRVNNKTGRGSNKTYRDVLEGRGYGIFKGHVWKYGDGGVIPEEWLEE